LPTSRSEPSWLPVEEVIDTAQDVVAETGEPFVLLDAGLLESALSRPRNHWEYGEDDILTLAIILLMAIARNHAFLQGNKRTAFICAEMLLTINGYSLAIRDSPILGVALERMIVGEILEEDFHLAVQDFIRETDQFPDSPVPIPTPSP
jgi:death-on-curing protein